MKFRYARVSKKEQRLEIQIQKLDLPPILFVRLLRNMGLTVLSSLYRVVVYSSTICSIKSIHV